MNPIVLIVDDDAAFREDLGLVLENRFQPLEAATGAEALELVRQGSPDAVLLDLMLGSESGLDLLARIQQHDPRIPVVMITEHASVDSAVEAMRRGAVSYVAKTTATDELMVLLDRALEERRLRDEASVLREEVERDWYEIVGRSEAVRELHERIELFARAEQTVLITGASGTGKELVARQIHRLSRRSDRPFVAVNCAALPKELMESELFGHEAGAFTGATRRKQGRVEAAGDGVVFFDEIGELDPGAQAKLLRLLEQKEYERVGGVRTLTTEARVLAATNRDLEALVEDGLFREDLFYRLDALRLNVPDLAQREGDIPLLVDHFLERVRLEMKGPRKSFSEAALAACEAHGWPGNVRELRNVVQSAAILAPGEVIEVEHLGGRVRRAAGNADETRRVGSAPAPGERVPESARELEQARRLAADEAARAVERAFLERLLQRHGGNISRAAREAGLDRSNLHRMMKRTGLA